MSLPNLGRLRDFVVDLGRLVERATVESELLDEGAVLLRQLVGVDDWLPPDCAEPHPELYRQYLLHCDSRERFSVVSFVWGAAQATPVHDHGVWGLIGMLRGAETGEPWRLTASGGIEPAGPARRLQPGDIDRFSPGRGDIHRVANAYDDRTSISIHVYGGNIGRIRRSIFDRDGAPRSFVSGYANDRCPNIWQP